jgi:formylglycine-generating enzyme required for sulfatase activity
MITIPGGSFNMGSDVDIDTRPVHRVSISTFSLSKYEVTNEEYCKFLNGIQCQPTGIYQQYRLIALNSATSHIKYSGNKFTVQEGFEKYPVVNVSWYGAHLFCEWIGGRLPTEAEWEYAAKGGNNQQSFAFSGSDQADEAGWYDGNSNGTLNPVGSKKANTLGLFDMTGNAWEWCSDNYDRKYYNNSAGQDPAGPRTGSFKVVRGGSYYCPEALLHNSSRMNYSPDDFINRGIGFRVCKTE